MYKKLDSINDQDIASEWDALAPVRFQQIASGQDITYQKILVPKLLECAQLSSDSVVVDAGCGVGFLTEAISQITSNVTGVDPSTASIAIANANFSQNATFVNSTLEEFSIAKHNLADVVFANMVLMDIFDIHSFLSSVKSILATGGKFLFTICHPCFWPGYYGYANADWFEYHQEIIIHGPFKISSNKNCSLPSTHVHRPLSRYVTAFHDVGFLISFLEEPMPTPAVHEMYPQRWKNPRYILGTCQKLR